MIRAYVHEMFAASPDTVAVSLIREIDELGYHERHILHLHASEELKGQVEALMVRAGKAEAERDALRIKLDRIKHYFADFDWDGREGHDDW